MPTPGVTMARMTPAGRAGGIGVLWLWGPEAWLRQRVDAEVVRDPAGGAPGAVCGLGALRRGWLRDGAGGVVDEVVVAKPREDFRMISGHGGPAMMDALQRHFAAQGVAEADPDTVDAAWPVPAPSTMVITTQ